MRLEQIIGNCGAINCRGNMKKEISAICSDSRKVVPGSMFIAVKGYASDGHRYIGAALSAGATAIMYEDRQEFEAQVNAMEGKISTDDIAFVQVANSRHAEAMAAADFYGNPSRELTLVGITGTNGKTTTTALTGEIMKNYFKDVRVVGNIGIPYTSMVTGSSSETVTVAEISSFQLETIDTFKPHVSAILNITPDHLNRHHTMENYIRAKEDITKNQTADDYCVLNYEDEVLRAFATECPAKVIFFSSKSELSEGFYLDGDIIIYAHDGVRDEVIDVNELNLLGKHNFENVMAACAMSLSFGVPMDKIVEVLKVFKAVEHRIEYVTEKRGVRFYNDSKGTNPDAAIQGIRAMNRPTLLIGGGYDKQSEYDEWIEAFDGKVKELVLIGQTADKIEECAHRHGFMNTVKKDTFEEAVNYCYEHAVSGDAVLLSPACASWGMFPNYEERGRIFKEIVKGFKE